MQVKAKDIKPGRVTLSGTVIRTVEQGESGIVFGLSDGRRLSNLPDEVWDVLPEAISAILDRPTVEEYVQALSEAFNTAVALAKREIIEDITDPSFPKPIPANVASFSELHDYTDANVYGGLCETVLDLEGETFMAFGNDVQNAVDAWIKEGGIFEALGKEIPSNFPAKAEDEVGDRIALVFSIDVTNLSIEARKTIEEDIETTLKHLYAVPYANATWDHDAERTIHDAIAVGLGH